jgi:hypothetical protein
MRSPLGLFVQVISLTSPPYTEGEVRKWFERIIRDYRRKGSSHYIETLVLEFIGSKASASPPQLCEEQLDWIKDYLPHFDYLFVGSIFPRYLTGVPYDITDDISRRGNIFAARNLASKFIRYLRTNNITIPTIHWYIEWEGKLDRFARSDIKNAFKEYFLQYTNKLTEISHDYGLNEPEFFWSPSISKRYNALTTAEKTRLVRNIRDLLESVPKLGWLHFQDKVGTFATKHPDGTITYNFSAEDAINYYHKILVPAASGTNLKSALINMEFFVFDEDGNTVPGDPFEHEERQCKYMRANIPVGISWEISYWYPTLTNEIEIHSLKNTFIDEGISFPVSIREVAHALGFSLPISIKDLVRCMRH